MQLTRITNRLVETCLRALRSGDQPPIADLAELALLGKPSAPEEMLLRFQDLLAQQIRAAYVRLRRAEQLDETLPETRSAILRQVGEDFSQGNSELEAWSALYARYLAAAALSVEEISAAASVVPQQLRRRLNQGLSALVAQLRRMEMDAPGQRSAGPVLPPPDYTHLLGVQPYFAQLAELLARAGGPYMVSLEGMGGIGKTALARAFAALPETAARWSQVLWVSARPYRLDENGEISALANAAMTLDDVTTRLARQLELNHLASKAVAEKLEGIRAVLQREPALVVVDNLETVADYTDLAPALIQCADPSRFLMTSRQTLRQIPYVHVIQLSELDPSAAYDLLQAEMARRGQRVVVSREAFAQLYRLTGGLPLAIKLAAAQLGVFPFQRLLERIRSASAGIENLYRFLYWQAWQGLSDPARRLLLSFLAIDPDGENLAFLQMASGQPDEIFSAAVRELDHYSLLEPTGDGSEPRYRLHRLTVTFLQTELLHSWEKKDPHG